jgi:intracellular sulfur oxidation DsrE/DsrF family protein
MKKFVERMAYSNRKSVLRKMIPALAISVVFFVIAVWMFVTGCSNALQINDLEENGVEVQVTVTGKRIDSSRENTENYYTFSYQVDNKTYEFTDSPDREYKVGETFTAYIDPEHPQNMVLPNSNLAFAFMLLIFSGGSLFIYEGFRFLTKYIPHALAVWAIAIVMTGVLLSNTIACVVGIVFLVAILTVWMLVCMKKKSVV